MEHLKMHSLNKIDENVSKIAQFFPNCVTEAKDENGEITHKIDFDMLKQELSTSIVDGREERYQFTWPDKKQAILTANAPINKTLRPCREESVNFDTTENLYIEGDNLEVLKLLQETYLGKIKMIYIDPPYNTGNDFVYEDDFAQNAEDYIANSGQYDEEGNRLVHNTESNGRFHTDWLNMMYPRLKLARDLLTDDGVIFISIDDNEVENLKKICEEVFSESNFVATFPWRKRTAKSDVPFGVSQDYEWILCCSKTNVFVANVEGKERKYYVSDDYPEKPWRIHDLTKQTTASERPNSYFTIVNPKNGDEYPCNPNATWRITRETFDDYYKTGRIVFPGDYSFLNISKPVFRYWKEDDMKKAGSSYGRVAVSTKLPDNIGMSQDGTKEITDLFKSKIFNFPKPSSLIKFLASIHSSVDSIILDFFSGSATTAHAVMQLNAEDGGKRKFITVQLPELTDEISEAYKAGYKNICEIGKERIRRAGKKVKEEAGLKGQDLDIGFRVLKIDSSNMQDVYYSPDDLHKQDLFQDNVKADRTAEDLLFQVMLDLGVELSSKIITKQINGKTIYYVNENYLVACFDQDITEETITQIAKEKPYYFVMKDSGFANDSVATNFEQIFTIYSADTVRKVL